MIPQLDDFSQRMAAYRGAIAATSNFNATRPSQPQTLTPTAVQNSANIRANLMNRTPTVNGISGSIGTDAEITQNGGAGSALVRTAMDYKGVPYAWGGESKKGIDCSGLTSQVAAKNGYKIPRTAASQYSWFKKNGKTVSYANAQPGDYLYFRSSGGNGWHTGVYLGNGKMLDAPYTGAVVRTDKVAGRKLVGVGRL